jgi:hypothetical protein
VSTFLAGLLLFNLAAVDEIAIDWAATPANCLPGVDAIDWRAEVHGDAGVILWWCEDEKYGMVEHSRVSQRGAGAATKLLSDQRDAAMIIESAPFRLRPVDADGVLVADMRHRFTPSCTAADSHATNPAGETIGELRLGQRIACGGLKTMEGGTHYCNVPGAPRVDGTLLPGDSWVRCEVVRAPNDGWDL